MIKIKVWLMYGGYALFFAVAFAVMLAVITAAVIAIPSGIFFGVMGIVLLVFESPYIVTELSPLIMLFGGLFTAFLAAFLGLLSVKLGFAAAKLFRIVRSRCDRLRGWCQ